MYAHEYLSNMECLAGQLKKIIWLCPPWHQSSQAHQNRVCRGPCTLLIPRTAHPVLRWLPTKLAEWIGENLQDELGFPDKADKRAEPGTGWTPAELNHILQSHVVDGALSTFECVEWESDLCRGVMRARCYPFDMPKHRFHGMNPKVLYILC